MTITVLKAYFKKCKPKIIAYRDYKYFSKSDFRTELMQSLFNQRRIYEMSNDEFSEISSKYGFLPKPSSIFKSWENEVKTVLTKGGLYLPEIFLKKNGGRRGEHSEIFGYLLSDLQYMQRAFPNSKW